MTYGQEEGTLAPAPATSQGREIPQAPVIDPLSGRERDVLLALGRGLTLKEIAAELGVAIGTVQSLCHRVYAKLGAHDRGSALRRYRALTARRGVNKEALRL